MIELLGGATVLLGMSTAVATYFAHSYRAERDEALLDLTVARGDIKSLTNRITTLKGDNIALEKQVDDKRKQIEAKSISHDIVANELKEAKRQIGRMEAEARAAAPKRGEGGRFVAKPKAPKPPKAAKAKPAPISCA